MIAQSGTWTSETLNNKSINMFPALIADYISGKENIRSLYNYEHKLSAFENVIAERRKFPVNRKVLTDVLLQQNHQLLEDYPLTKSNIESLLNENTFTVTTGHQLCIFTGPLYFIYKIISVINLTEELKRLHPDCNFVPVYWMASEDHDFEEINHIHLFNKKLEWKQEDTGAVGALDPETMSEVLTQLKEIMGDSGHSGELFRIFEEAYMFNPTLADAMRFLVMRLLGQYGLVVMDGNAPELKRLFIPVLKDELQTQSASKYVEETNTVLHSLNYKVQVTPRNINLFFMEDGVRERMVKAPDGHFEVVNTDLRFSEEMLFNLLEKQPERFSPNVVLRPVYQEYILPNLAYVGGPGEISYWLQYKSLFGYHKVHFPMLVQRESVLILDRSLLKKMDQYNISVEDLFLSQEVLIKKYILEESGDFDVSGFTKQGKMLFSDLMKEVTAIDQTLGGTVSAEEQKLLNAIELIKKKVLAAVKRQHDASVNQIKGMKDKVFPEGVLQERHLNFIPFYLSFGSSFMETLKKEIKVFRGGMLLLRSE